MPESQLDASLSGAIYVQEALVLGQAKGRLVLKSPSQELLLSDQLRYIPRIGSDELHDGKLRWKLERGERAAICELIARHRLGLKVSSNATPPLEAHLFLESPYAWWLEWLAAQCQPEETPLCALKTGEKRDLESQYEERESMPEYLVWTTHRVFLAYAGRLGDVSMVELKAPLRVESKMRGDDLVCGQERYPLGAKYSSGIGRMVELMQRPACLWRVGLMVMILGAQGETSARLAAASAEHRGDPALSIVAPLWKAKAPPADRNAAAWEHLDALWELILEHAKREQEPPAEVTMPEVESWLDALSVEGLAADTCFEQSWPMGRLLAHLVGGVPDAGRDALLKILDSLCPPHEEGKDLEFVEQHLARNCVLAELFARCGDNGRAHTSLMQLISALPSPADLELLMGEEEVQAPLRHLLDLLVHRALGIWPQGAAQRNSLLEIRASLVPLSLSRVDEWLAACDAEERTTPRVQRVRDQLQALGQDAPASEPPSGRVRRLNDSQIESRLVHPAARTSRSGALQAMLAKLETPDHSALKQYCDPGKEGVLAKEVERVAALFDKEPVDVFISHGDRRYGVMAYEGEPSFVLVGGEHRRPESAAHLGPAQLRFVLGAELAHLYLGHARVTSQEVLSGAWDKGKATFEVLTSLVPFLSAFPWGKRLGKWTGYFDNKLVSRSAQRIRDYFGGASGDSAQNFTLDRSVGLIAAHRMMQLTADRAGLLLCDNLGEAILGMWKLRPQSVEYVGMLRDKGVQETIQAMADAEIEAWRTLSTRAAALTAFAWSEEFEALRDKVWSTRD